MNDREKDLKRRIRELRDCLAEHPEIDMVRAVVYELVKDEGELARLEGKDTHHVARAA